MNVVLHKVVGDSLFMCRGIDISEDGLYLSRLLEPRPSNDDVVLEFALPGEPEIIWARGEIVREGQWRWSDASAIRFTALADGFRRLIKRYVARYEFHGI
jgi:hypothetical protein